MKNLNWFTSTKKVAVALVAMFAMTGCPAKKSNNGYGFQYGYNYGTYCNAVSGCYGQQGYGQMFASALGKINNSQFQAEVAVNFQVGSGGVYGGINSYAGNTQMIGTLNVYSSSPFCPIAPGQYQLMGNGMFGSGIASHSFTGTIVASYGGVQILFPNNFISAITSTSLMGPSFPFAIQNDVVVTSPYGSCGTFVME